MAIVFVVEGKVDAAILRKLLPSSILTGAKFYAAGGKASLATVARNILVYEGGPVMVVMDADTLDEDQARQNRAMTLATLRGVTRGVAVDVFAFLPEPEVMFFEAPEALTEFIGQESIDRSVVEKGQLLPRKTLQQLAGTSGHLESLVDKITPEGTRLLRSGAQASRLIHAVEALAQAG